MKIYQLRQRQEFNSSPESLWEFIATPRNLDRVTPPDMRFEILSDLPPKMYSGQLVEYRISLPFMGKQTWLTELKHIEEGRSFVDEQRFGPYSFWYHRHEIRVEKGRTLMYDEVSYALPFGILGRIVHALYVRKKLRSIFEYRRQILSSLDNDKSI